MAARGNIPRASAAGRKTIHPKEVTTIMFNIINILFNILLWTIFGAVIWAIAPIIQKLLGAAQHVHHFFQ
jgi:hypothetical protein